MGTMDTNFRTKECIECGNTEFLPHAEFCKTCGHGLYNLCSDEECNSVNLPNSNFCEVCGSETLFYKELKMQGLVD